MRKTEQLNRLREKLIKNSKEGILISSEVNQRYFSGFDYTDGYILVMEDKAYLLADSRYIEAARATVSAEDFEVIKPEGSMLSELALIAAERHLKKLYVEESELCCDMMEALREKLKRVKIVSGASDAILAQRAIKSDFELQKIAKAQAITDRAFEHILGFIKEGVTEKEIALELEFFMRKNGAEATAFDTIAVSGRISSMPHGVPRDMPIEKGFLTMDFGARVDGYCADMTRTVVIGKADAEMKRLYDTVLRAQKAVLDALCEGIGCRYVDSIARDIINLAGYKGCFGHSLGHGVGMFVHESPRFSPASKDVEVLCRGNVVTVEPGIYIEGKYGCRIEDMIALDHSGRVINFTASPKELIEI